MTPSARSAPNLLFVSVTFSGHLNPTIAVARACNQRRLSAAKDASTPATHAPDADAAVVLNGAAAPGAVRFAALSRDRSKVEAAGLEFVDLGELSTEDEKKTQQMMAVGPSANEGKDSLSIGCQLFTLMERAMFPPLVEALGSGGAAAGTDAIVADFATLVGGGWAGQGQG
jgi:UDP:flavonoid glycosyltransferase YjiC (YdhE family)